MKANTSFQNLPKRRQRIPSKMLGATLVEYALIAGLIIGAILVFINTLKNSANNYYLNQNNSFNYVTDDVLVN